MDKSLFKCLSHSKPFIKFTKALSDPSPNHTRAWSKILGEGKGKKNLGRVGVSFPLLANHFKVGEGSVFFYFRGGGVAYSTSAQLPPPKLMFAPNDIFELFSPPTPMMTGPAKLRLFRWKPSCRG